MGDLRRGTRFLVLSQLLWGTGFGFIITVWPLFMGELGAAPADIGFVIGVGNVVSVLAIVPAGVLADRIGRKPLVLTTNAAAMVGAASFLVLTDWRGAFLGSALFWSGVAGGPIVIALVAATEPRARLGRALGIVLGSFNVGIILAAPLAGMIAAATSTRSAIAVAVALFVGATIALAFVDDAPRIAASGARLPRAFWSLIAVAPLAAFVTQLPIPLLPVFLRDAGRLPVEQIGLLVGIYSVGNALFIVLSGRLGDRLGPSAVIIATAGVFSLGALLLTLAAGSPLALAVGALLMGANLGANPVVAATLERVLPPERATAGYASLQLTFNAGLGAAAITAGVLYEGGPALPLVVAAALALPLATLIALTVRRLAGSASVPAR